MSENEAKKEYLWRYQAAVEACKRIELQKAELRLNRIMPATANDGMPHGNGTSDLSSYAAKLDEIEQKLFAEKYKRICVFQEITSAINDMEDETEKTLLTYRYIKRMKWEEIAVKMGYSWQHIHKIHARALRNFKMR